jgi:tRNA (guanosine-2'-O-)-methyltransferase
LRRGLGLALSATFLGCAATTTAPPKAANVVASELAAPEGSTLVETCTPTGPELCFNAIDDNCNGVIDEGCGPETGLLQFTIAWSAPSADVNLSLTAPGGQHVPSGSERVSGPFHLDRDCPGDEGCGGQNVENVYFEGEDPPRGKYEVEIALEALHGEEPPVQVHFGARLGSRTVGFDVSLAPGDDTGRKKFTFVLP